MKNLGVDIAKLIEMANDPLHDAVVPSCPGARLRLTRGDYDNLSSRGERFASRRDDIPFDAMGDARVFCDREVGTLPRTASGNTQYYGLCHSCSGLEADNRRILRERAKLKGDR